MSRFAVVVLLIGSAGCRQLLGFENAVVPDDAVSPLPDAGPCSALTSECVGDTLRTCTVVGELPVDTACEWGCVDDDGNPHCGVQVPAGGALVPEDVDPAELAMLPDLILTGNLSTDAGTLNGIALPGEFKVVGTVGVLRAKSIRVSGALQLVGTRALAMVATDITVDGVIDAQGSCNGSNAGPGGFSGGAVEQPGLGPGGGGGGDSDNGGGGGGHGGTGGAGGIAGATMVAGGVSYGDPAIAQLFGGSGGGGGFENSSNVGGGGGGAVQLVSTGALTINSGGGINAGGCGPARQNCPVCTSGGGGAGGTILLEALTITMAGVLAVNGGGGAGSGSEGEDGLLSRDTASGGDIGNGGAGGDGGAASQIDGQNAPAAGQRPGGGGGAVGRIRFHTRDGTAMLAPGAVMSPNFTDAGTTATIAPAPVK